MNMDPINRFVMRVGEAVITILDFLRFVFARKHRSTRASIICIEMERHMTRQHCLEMADYFRACLANRDVSESLPANSEPLRCQHCGKPLSYDADGCGGQCQWGG